METKVNALNEHHMFVRDLITAYRQLPLLWDKTHPKRNDRYERSEAYETLLTKVREYYPEADEDFVRLKIQSLRNSFRKEHRKVIKSKETASKPEDIHKPQLWYYNLLLFTANDNSSSDSFDQSESLDGDELNNSTDDIRLEKLCYWSLEHTALLINTYKLYPCLYSASDAGYKSRQKRDEAIKKVTNELIRTTGKEFKEQDILRKMRTLRGQFLRETVKMKRYKASGKIYKSQWCFCEMLEFLRPEFNTLLKRKFNCDNNENADNATAKIKRYNDSETDDSTNEEMIVISRESPPPPQKDDEDDDEEASSSDDKLNLGEEESIDNFENDQHFDSDLFETIARNVAHQLREMAEEQRCIAERLIRDILYHGTMENLTVDTKLIL